MNALLFEKFKEINSVSKFREHFDNQKVTYISPLPGSARSLLIKTLFAEEKQIVIFLPNRISVDETKVELSELGFDKDLIVFNEFSQEAIQENITTLAKKKIFILLSTYRLLKTKLPNKQELKKNTTILEAGSDITYDELIDYLELLNYSRDKYVGNPGDFSVRGSLIDFWSYSEKLPCRVEFDGDFLESIRNFDPESQRSSGRVDSVSLAPNISDSEETINSTIFDYLDNSITFAQKFELRNICQKPKKKSIEIDSIENDIDPELKEELFEEHEEDEKNEDENTDDTECDETILNFNELLSQNVRWIIEEEISEDNSRFDFHLSEAPIINSNFDHLFRNLIDHSAKNFQIIITAENELRTKRLADLLIDFKDELAELIDHGKIKIIDSPIKDGFISKSDKLLILTDYQIFNKPYRTTLPSKSKYKKSKVKDFASIKKGDYVVHETFGIGKYVGLETIKIGLIEQESIKILYAEGGVVYVNLNYLSLIKKFSSNEDVKPRLSTLGSNEWKNTKKKVKSKIKDAARELIKLYALRKASPGFQYSEDTIWQNELEASFLYQDTPDQVKVTEEVKNDMENGNPMDRLVCGDVGFGKTEIAVRAAFKAVSDGKQVGLLVPTTILAEQHFSTFKERLSQFPVKVAVLSRFVKQSVQKEIVQQLAEGKIDIVIGTHRLLSKDIKFKDLGLLIIDEEHRFGVMAKEKLRSLKANVDTLTLTATPIPRTLNLSLLGARDLSIIATPPPNRQPIYTQVQKFDIIKVRGWIKKEIDRGGQIYFVHDRVQSIDKIAEYLRKHIPNVKIGVAHGQMKSSSLEKVLHDFMNREYHILLATKIIESGLDIPNVNTIVINRADRFGLAELHQLRGRVGRSNRQAFAYLLVPSLKTISKKALRRLQAIKEYTDLGEGFNLSMRDLEIRGAGNLLGTEQSGAIDSVGFDMYVKMLDETVEELKQSEFKEEFKELPVTIDRSEPTIDTYFELGIPQNYMPDQSDRLSYYTAMFSIVKVEEVEEIKEDMEDRFGKMPKIVEHLMMTAVLRYYASITLLERIVILRDRITIILPKADREDFYKDKFSVLMQMIMNTYSKRVQFKQVKDVMKLEMKNEFRSTDETLNYLIDFIKEIHSEVIISH
ncbi:Transcription-repair coupling factor [hydrothermal vent metagenome]|uniref:Transcription-repair coupling factor n=1 Tax=hydrothermal vent metagenome TaxID=652676 RepID=A0A3B1BZJ1_9ZZZZ